MLDGTIIRFFDIIRSVRWIGEILKFRWRSLEKAENLFAVINQITHRLLLMEWITSILYLILIAEKGISPWNFFITKISPRVVRNIAIDNAFVFDEAAACSLAEGGIGRLCVIRFVPRGIFEEG